MSAFFKQSWVRNAVTVMKKCAEDFEFDGTVDVGSYSTVVIVKEKCSGKIFAAKVVSKKRLCARSVDANSAVRERDILNRCKELHIPGVVTLHYTFQDEWSLYYILDYCENGNVKEYLKKADQVTVQTKLEWAKQILSVLAALHRHNILHGDIKPENCLLNKQLSIVLCDFNSAHQLECATDTAKFVNSSAAFMSPESIQTSTTGLPADIWAFGCLLFELFTLESPFGAETEYLSMRKVLDKDLTWLAPLHSPQDLQHNTLTDTEESFLLISDLISQCFDHEPTKRITADAALLHPALNGIT